jgi:hypothetical protein
MLKSSGSEGRGVTSKVADFGLAVKMDSSDTHISGTYQGTMTHMWAALGGFGVCTSWN